MSKEKEKGKRRKMKIDVMEKQSKNERKKIFNELLDKKS